LSRVGESVRRPPWPKHDERGMGNILGPETWVRCAPFLTDPRAKCYELSHVVSSNMPMSPFSKPLAFTSRPTRGMRGAIHASNMDQMTGEPGGQGTHIDALGHFGFIPRAWDGETEFPTDAVCYYGEFTQSEVKPTSDSPLLRLGVDKIPPIITTALLLDARTHLGNGSPLEAGREVTAKDIVVMMDCQGLSARGILPGDVVYIYTGWSDRWKDTQPGNEYYTMGPGLSYDAAEYLAGKLAVLVALDNPFTDPVNPGQLKGGARPPSSMPEGKPFGIHHFNLTQAGIFQIQNAKLDVMARERVWISCTMILPLRIFGGAGSLVRAVAIGAPGAGSGLSSSTRVTEL
jgi:kynurenine formamidase